MQTWWMSQLVGLLVAVPCVALEAGADLPNLPSPHVDVLHGVQVADPFRWLEQDGPQTEAWLTAQDRHARAVLDAPDRAVARQQIRTTLERVWNYPKRSAPSEHGGRYFWRYNSGVQNQAGLWWGTKPDATGTLLLDPNTLAADGTVALQSAVPSRDGKLLAWAISRAGSDWQEIRVREVDSGKDRADALQWVKFSAPVWNADATGFWYSRYDAPADGAALTGVNKFQKLCFHKLGEPQSADRVEVEAPDQPDWGFGAELSEDGRFLIITVWKGAEAKNQLWVKDLHRPQAQLVKLVADFRAAYEFVGNVGTELLLQTDDGAERGQIVAVDLTDPAKPVQRTLVAQSKDALRGAVLSGQQLVLHYLRNASSALVLQDVKGGKPRPVRLPIASVQGLQARQESPDVFVQLSSFFIPGRVLRLRPASGELVTLFDAKVDAKLGGYEAKQIWATSKDGTAIPAFVVRKRGGKGPKPTYLYAYGGFNASLTPSFSPAILAWLELGGTYVVANLRGGGEFGRAWHESGMREKKQNVFEDFYAVARKLVADGHTQPSLLGIGGGSNGGLLVGAALTQHPELFGAALPAVGVMDMLRFHKFTIGWAWVPEYGSADDQDAFGWLRAYSPYHNIRPGRFPATMVLTADHDDRVVPAHSYKFTAALQLAQQAAAPVLLRLDRKAGHGAGKPTAKLIDEFVDRWDFLLRYLQPAT